MHKIALLNQKHFYDPSQHLLYSLSLHTVLLYLQHLSWGHLAIHSTIRTCREVFMCNSKAFNCPTRSLGTCCGTSVFLFPLWLGSSSLTYWWRWLYYLKVPGKLPINYVWLKGNWTSEMSSSSSTAKPCNRNNFTASEACNYHYYRSTLPIYRYTDMQVLHNEMGRDETTSWLLFLCENIFIPMGSHWIIIMVIRSINTQYVGFAKHRFFAVD